MNIDRLKELAAGFASGSLDSAERTEFSALLAQAPAEARSEAAAVVDTAAILALGQPAQSPPASLKQRILHAARPPESTPDLFEFVRRSETGWVPMRVPGAFVKLLSLQRDRGYAVVLGKLDPGTSYPAHQHIGSEQIFILEGDLRIGEFALGPGDFHNAKAGSAHGVNYSEKGCTIMAIVSIEDLTTLLPA